MTKPYIMGKWREPTNIMVLVVEAGLKEDGLSLLACCSPPKKSMEPDEEALQGGQSSTKGPLSGSMLV